MAVAKPSPQAQLVDTRVLLDGSKSSHVGVVICNIQIMNTLPITADVI